MPEAKDELDAPAAALMVVLCAIWGVQQVAIKVTNAGISPLLQAGLRSLGAAALVLAWSASRRVRLLEPDGTLVAGVAAGLLFALEFACIYWGLGHTSPSRAVVFLYCAPFLVALGARRWLPRERMGPAQWGGLALAFCGVLALFGENLLRPAGRAWVGDLLVLAGAAFWAATTLVVKATPLAGARAEKTLLYQLAVSGLVLPPLSLALGERGVFDPAPLVLACLAFQILVVASTSYLAWFWLVRRYPATRLSAFSFLTPAMGVLASHLLLGDPLTPALLAALALLATGIWLANRAPAAR